MPNDNVRKQQQQGGQKDDQQKQGGQQGQQSGKSGQQGGQNERQRIDQNEGGNQNRSGNR